MQDVAADAAVAVAKQRFPALLMMPEVPTLVLTTPVVADGVLLGALLQ